MSLTQPYIRLIGFLAVSGLLFAVAGCSANNAGPAASKTSPQQQDYLKAWKDASKHQADEIAAEDAKPLPEPKLQPMTHFSAAAMYEKQGRLELAIDQYRKAIELNPNFVGAYARLGLCYTKIGQCRMAVEALAKAAQLQPKSATIWNNLGFAQLIMGDPAAAQKSLAKALAIAPTYERSRINMAMALVRQGRDADALSHLESVSANYIALYNLGSMQLAVGRAQPARASFEKALDLRPEFPAARKSLQQAMTQLAAAPATQPADVAEPAQAVRSPATRPATAIATTDKPSSAEPAPAITAAAPVAPVAAPPAIAEPAQAVTDTTPAAPSSTVVPQPFDDIATILATWLEFAAKAPCAVDLPSSAVPHTAVSPARVTSIADADLTSLQWFAWSQLIQTLHADIQSLPDQRLVQIMRKWLTALDQLQDMTRPVPAIAMAR